MNNYSCRNVQENDLTAICSFPLNGDELYFMFPKADFPLTLSQLAKAISVRSDSMVALLNDVVVGFANFYEVERNRHCAIGNVIIHPAYRRQGVAKYLIGIMENIALEKYNATETHLSCFNTNTAGLLLYTTVGYTPYEVELRQDKHETPIALIKMKKDITLKTIK